MKFVPRRSWLALAGPAAALLLLLSAPAADAAPTVTSVDCESGLNHLLCDVYYTGAVGAVTVQWVAYSGGSQVFTAYGKHLSAGCFPGSFYTLDVFVSDSTGTTHASTGLTCRSGSYQ
jgi:hypothetical protein